MSNHIATEPIGRSAFGDALREWRRVNAYTIEAAAEAIEVSVPTYRSWEYGKMPRPEKFKRITAITGIDVWGVWRAEVEA